jgi:hypothetical protein
LPAIDAACTAEEMAACVLVVGLKESIVEAFLRTDVLHPLLRSTRQKLSLFRSSHRAR